MANRATKRITPAQVKRVVGEVLQNHANGAPSDRLRQLVTNAAMLLPRSFNFNMDDRRRDLDDECGYPKQISAETYQAYYLREALARRVVEIFPRQCWAVQPSVYENEDQEVETPWEKAFDELAWNLRGNKRFKDPEGNAVWEALKWLDIRCGIGHYGVLLFGLDDGKPGDQDALAKPVQEGRKHKLLYLKVFSEWQAQVSEWDDDINSERYGRPKSYQIYFSSPNATLGGSYSLTSRMVHHSRVLHVAEGPDVVHTPRLESVFNRMYDVRKVLGPSAEMFFKGGFPGIQFKVNPTADTSTLPLTQLKDQVEQFVNSLQRYLLSEGGEWNVLAPAVADPTPQFMVQVQAVAMAIGCPQRILLGSERGELSSSQDQGDWNDKLGERQKGFITPGIIQPFVNRSIDLGLLPDAEELHVWWPDLESQTDGEKADVAVKKTQAMAAYVAGQVNTLMPELPYLTRVMGFDEEEAEQWLKEAEENMVAKEEEDIARQKQLIDEGLMPDPVEEQKMKAKKPGGNGKPNPFAKKKPVGSGETENAFCPTGEGGGQDNSCSPTGGRGFSGPYKGPEGYKSQWSNKPQFIVRTMSNNEPTYVVVVQGEQPSAGTPFPSLRDARAYMKDNGFEPMGRTDNADDNNCGTGAGGFQEGNTCAGIGGGTPREYRIVVDDLLKHQSGIRGDPERPHQLLGGGKTEADKLLAELGRMSKSEVQEAAKEVLGLSEVYRSQSKAKALKDIAERLANLRISASQANFTLRSNAEDANDGDDARAKNLQR